MNLARQWHHDSTAAVSNVEPNTVAPNAKDKTVRKPSIHPAVYSHSKWQRETLAKIARSLLLFKTILNARRHSKWTQQSILIINTVTARRRLLLQVFLFILRWFPLTRASSKLLVYYYRAGISKGASVDGIQFGTPIVKNDLNKLVSDSLN